MELRDSMVEVFTGLAKDRIQSWWYVCPSLARSARRTTVIGRDVNSVSFNVVHEHGNRLGIGGLWYECMALGRSLLRWGYMLLRWHSKIKNLGIGVYESILVHADETRMCHALRLLVKRESKTLKQYFLQNMPIGFMFCVVCDGNKREYSMP